MRVMSFLQIVPRLAFLLLFVSRTHMVHADELRIAAAADLAYCLEDIRRAFETAHPDIHLKISTGSSGDFFAQIQRGAPFEVYLSADINYPKQLIALGFASADSLYVYGRGRIALWSTLPGLDLTPGLALVSQSGIKRVAIANPEHAPYGKAAKSALTHEKLWDAVEPKLVIGENIAQTAQFVETGNADVGIVALSLLLSPKLANKGHYQLIPEAFYPPLDQAAVITTAGQSQPASSLFMAYIRTSEGRRIFQRFGFVAPDLVSP